MTNQAATVAETLEDKTLLSGFSPIANDDSYTAADDTLDTLAESLASVLANDDDLEGDPLTATLISGPAHGTLTSFGSNGHSVFEPDKTYEGTDSFVYETSDGTGTDTATVTLTITKPFGEQLNENDTPVDEVDWYEENYATSRLTGDLQIEHPADPRHRLVYQSTTLPRPIVSVETTFSIDAAPPDEIEAILTFNGTTEPSIWYDTSTLSPGEDLRFSLQADATSLSSGHYAYQVDLVAHYSSGTATRRLTGYQDIVNRNTSEFGVGWNVEDLDRLVKQGSDVLYVHGNAETGWFTDSGGGNFTSPSGPMASNTLIKNADNTFTLTTRHGFQRHFNSDGLLTSRVDPNGNTTGYSYVDADSDGQIDELETITDPFGRETEFTNSSGLVSAVVDFAGRTTSLSQDASGRTISITAPDPDDSGPLAAPVTDFSYSTDDLLNQKTDPLGHTTQFAVNHGYRLKTATNADSTVRQFEPIQTSALVDTSGGLGSRTNPAPLFYPLDAESITTDELSNTTDATTDQFGYPLSYTDALGNLTAFQRNSDGQVTRITRADPDGGGSQSGPVTSLSYDSRGNQTGITHPDTATETWFFHPTLNRPTRYTDELNRNWSFTYDANGNVLTATDPLCNTTTMTYTSRGQVATTTGPDPDDAGPLQAAVVSITYDSNGRPTQVTQPDNTTLQFSWTTADQLATSTDARGRVTSFSWDNLDRMTSMTLPDPDGAGPQSAPLTSYVHDADSRRTQITDPSGNDTTFAFDSRHRLTTLTRPDPDGSGPGTSPVTSFSYDTVSNLLSEVTDALGNDTSFAYDAEHQLLSVTLPDPDGAGPQSAPETTYEYDNLGRVISVADPRNNATSYSWNNRDWLTEITDPLNNSTSLTHNAVGELVAIADGAGNTGTYAYTATGWLTSVTLPDPDGPGPLARPQYLHGYDNLGRLTSDTDPLGNQTSYAYGITSELTSTTNALGGVTSMAYDDAGNMTSWTLPDPDGIGPLTAPVTSWVHDDLDRVTSTTDALYGVRSFSYDIRNNLISETDELGRTTSYSLDNLNRVTDVTDALSNTSSIDYDKLNNVTGFTDALSNTTQFAYDNLSRLIKTTNALGGTVENTYDGNNNLTSRKNELGSTTSFAYDERNALTTLTDPLFNTQSYTYADTGYLVTSTDKGNNQTSYGHDTIGRLTSVTDALGNQESYTYDAAGNVTSQTNALGQTTTYGRDALHRVTSITDNLNNQTTRAYDALSRVTSVTDPLGHAESFEYDALSRMTKRTDPQSGVTQLAWDAVGNMTSLTDPRNNTTSFAFDALNQMTSQTNALSQIRVFGYDEVGNLTSQTDRNGQLREFDFDALGRNTEERWMQSGTPLRTISFTLDSAGQVLTGSDADSSYSYTYDALGQVTEVDNLGTPNVPNVVLESTLDARGNRTELTATIGTTDDFRNEYAFDAVSQMTQVQQQGQFAGNSVAEKRVDLSYNAIGQFSTITMYADLAGMQTVATSSSSYDGAGRLTGLSHMKDTTTLGDYNWGFDSASRITSSTSTDGSSDYTYDTTDQLTDAVYSYQTDEGYSYDANGNRTNTGYQTGTNNQLLSDGTYDYEYDDEGNRTKKTHRTTGDYVEYSWDYRNRLTQVDVRNSTGTLTKRVAYTYDVFDRRIGKQVDENGNGTFDRAEWFVYDGTDIVLVFDDASALTHRYLHGPAIDQIFADEDASGDVLWALADNQGTVRDLVEYDAVLDQTTVANHLKYNAFGQITSESDPSVEFLYAYTGREWDADAELYYYRARWYDPVVGRFVSEDSVGFAGDDLNLVRYVENNPVNWSDPAGLFRYDPNDPGPLMDNYGAGGWLQPISGAQHLPYAWDAIGQVGSNALTGMYGNQAGYAAWSRAWAYWSARQGGGDLSIVTVLAPSGALNRIDQFATGIADVLTFGGVTSIRNQTYGSIATQNHSGAVYTAGQWTGVGIGFALGFGGGAGGGAAAQVAANWTRLDTLVGVVVGSKNVMTGQASWWDVATFAPAVGYGAGRMRKAMKRTGDVADALPTNQIDNALPKIRPCCFVAGTEVVIAGGDLGPFVADTSDADAAVPVGWSWTDTVVVFAAGAIVLTSAHLRSKRNSAEANRYQTIDDLFTNLDVDPDVAAENGDESTKAPDEQPIALAETHNAMAPVEITSSRAKTTLSTPPAHPTTTQGGQRPRVCQSRQVATQSGRRPRSSFWGSRLLSSLVGSLLLGWLLVGWFSSDVPSVVASTSASATSSARGPFLTKPIEQIRIGERVLARNPLRSEVDRRFDEPTPETWRHLTLRLRKPDGQRLDIELLRPLAWINAVGAHSERFIHLNLAELGANGFAEVVSVAPCPPIATGTGSVVTGTFSHAASNVITVRIDGIDTPIGTTANHPFWSEDRRAFLPAGELRRGERLRSAGGHTIRVSSISRRGPPATVYNIEVQGQHVYYVSTGAVLVHNSCDLGGHGNIDGGLLSQDSVLGRAEDWLEPGYREIAPDVFRSADGTRQFRMRTSDLTNRRRGPHVHFEAISPDGRGIIENAHIGVVP